MHAPSLVLFPSPLVDEIVAVAEPIDTTISAIEPGFAALGVEVEPLHKSAAELVRTCPSLAASPIAAASADEPRRLLTTEFEALVSLLQAGDSLRQRGEHVVVALHEISAWLASADSRLDFGLRATEVDCLLALQIRQLAAVRSDIDATYACLQAVFSAIAAAADDFTTRSQLCTPSSSTALNCHSSFLCAQLRSAATRSTGRLGFLPVIARCLEQQHDAITAIRRNLAPHVDPSLDTAAITRRFAQHYTTAAERAVSAGAPPPAASASNLEIFEP